MTFVCILLILGLAAVSALPTDVLMKREPLRYQYVDGPDGIHLVDHWTKISDLQEAARYNPDSQNQYHLFTRQNPTVSQPLLMGADGLLGLTNWDPRRRTVVILHGWFDSVTSAVNTVLVPDGLGDNVPTSQNPTVSQPLLMGADGLLGLTNWDPRRRTVVILHGWFDSVTSAVNTVLVPAFLSAENVNVIVVDWSAGGNTANYIAAVANTVTAGKSVARFINWLNSVTGASASNYHIVGHSLGGHMAGIIGRNVDGEVAYITGLDPMFTLWNTHDEKFRSTDGRYTEVIHTNAGRLGYVATLADVDFYPNGGASQPGCSDQTCDHHRSFHFMAESLLSGGFTGRHCVSFAGAMAGNCFLLGRLRMGGLVPKTGNSGSYYLETNPAPPFSRG